MGQGFRQIDPVALRALIEDSGVSFRQNQRSYIFTCPRCEKKDKLMMYKADGRFVCWVCAETSGFKGRPEYALTELLSLHLDDIKKRIYGDTFDRLPTDYLNLHLNDFFADDEVVPRDIKVPRGTPWPMDFYPMDHKFATKGREYLIARGFTVELMTAYDIRYCPVQRRVAFPVKVGDKLLGWQARAVFPTEWEDEEGNTRTCLKIITTLPPNTRDQTLMFQDRLAGMEHAVLCEGPVDAIKAHLCGGNVAAMGKVVSRQQVQVIRNAGIKRIYLGLDPDAATETQRLVESLGDLDVYRIEPAQGYDDLGDMSPEQVLEQFGKAQRVLPGQLFLHFRKAY